jgi:hypothetical protein
MTAGLPLGGVAGTGIWLSLSRAMFDAETGGLRW